MTGSRKQSQPATESLHARDADADTREHAAGPPHRSKPEAYNTAIPLSAARPFTAEQIELITGNVYKTCGSEHGALVVETLIGI